MSYYARPMRREDIAQVNEIDREAFPTQWPPADYRHELQNRLAHYIVVADTDKMLGQPGTGASPQNGFAWLMTILKRLSTPKHNHNSTTSTQNIEYIAGFVGIWILADEAHIINIAVRETYRHQGIGELLLISAIDVAKELKARIMTLEVRVSNLVAQNLYRKYNFTQVGQRRGYYTDNREDAFIMSTEDIVSTSFQTQFQQRKQAYPRKYS